MKLNVDKWLRDLEEELENEAENNLMEEIEDLINTPASNKGRTVKLDGPQLTRGQFYYDDQ